MKPIFDEVRDTNKRAQNQIKLDLFVLSSESIFDEVRDSANRAKYQIYFLLFASEQSSSGVFPISYKFLVQ